MKRGWILGVLAVLVLAVGAGSTVYVRNPIAAGLYYPAEKDKLLAAVNQYTDAAKVPDLPGRYLGCIAPHSAFPYAGSVAAHAFRPLKQGQYDRVIILGSSHFAQFEGCSIPAVQFFRTPLGDVELDGPAIAQLEWCPQIDTRSLTHATAKRFSDGSVRYPLHEVEYSIELMLPFLQARLGRFRLVPVVVGSFAGREEGAIDEAALRSAAQALREIVDNRTFIVASTDLTHFGDAYGYRPFNQDIPERIEELDVQAIELLMKRNMSGFHVYMEASENRICGVAALDLFMRLMPKGTEGVLLDYRMSSEITGNTDTSVSYASIAFYNAGFTPAESKPLSSIAPVVPKAPPQEKAVAPPLVPRGTARKAAPPAKEESEKKGLLRWFGKDKDRR